LKEFILYRHHSVQYRKYLLSPQKFLTRIFISDKEFFIGFTDPLEPGPPLKTATDKHNF